MNHANRTGLQGGIPGSASDNPRAPKTDFMADMMMAGPKQPQEPTSATAAASATAPATAGATAPAVGAEAPAAAAESAAAGDSAAAGAG